jgi:hypothetical protein
VDFENFNGGLDYNSRKIDLLVELRGKAEKALEVNKKIDKSKENVTREQQLKREYDWYV